MELFDAHNHLHDRCFEPDKALKRSREQGVVGMVVNGTKPGDWSDVLKLEATHKEVVAALGIHPWKVAEAGEDWDRRLEKALEDGLRVIGEIGLDQWVEPRDEALQEKVFLRQLAMARDANVPVTIHCLRAGGWLADLLSKHPLPEAGAHLHGFGGSQELVKQFVDKGILFSFSGYALDPNRKRMRVAVTSVPLEQLMLETDAPDMPPPESAGPFSFEDSDGNTCSHPANLAAGCRGLAALRGEAPEDLARATTANAKRLFLTNARS